MNNMLAIIGGILMACIFILVGCIDVKVGTQKINVYEQYPTYPVEPRPALTNLTGDDNDPHKSVAFLAQKIMSDGVITLEEKKQFADAMASAETLRSNALDKKVANDRALIKWGRINQAALESYNQYAAEKNERLKLTQPAAK